MSFIQPFYHSSHTHVIADTWWSLPDSKIAVTWHCRGEATSGGENRRGLGGCLLTEAVQINLRVFSYEFVVIIHWNKLGQKSPQIPFPPSKPPLDRAGSDAYFILKPFGASTCPDLPTLSMILYRFCTRSNCL